MNTYRHYLRTVEAAKNERNAMLSMNVNELRAKAKELTGESFFTAKKSACVDAIMLKQRKYSAAIIVAARQNN